MAYIYCITNDVNGKQYVGKTEKTIEERFKEHCKDYQRRRCEKRPLYAAMNKYGIEHFHIEILEKTDNPEEREIYWIKKLDTFHNGYNATKGGDGKRILDYEMIINLYKELQSIKLVAEQMQCSTDSVHNILVNHNIEIIPSWEVLSKQNSKIVKQYTKNTHELINIFPSIAEAGKALDLGQGRRHIAECCKGKRKSAYGYAWEFGDMQEWRNWHTQQT